MVQADLVWELSSYLSLQLQIIFISFILIYTNVLDKFQCIYNIINYPNKSKLGFNNCLDLIQTAFQY